ncbi:MAG: sulfotransferase family 2 domain-containing protein [Planctomycetaceae bacterium]|nr:sulfotransferase family 2 domain-containing protein [Planctomycetaceae bacterium]
MIVSHAHQFLFVAIPKTGTHAVREALRPHLGSRDWEQCRLFVEKAMPVERLAAIGHGHLTCCQIREHLHPFMWQRYLKFCFIRNPVDRFVSYCRFINRDNNRMTRDPLGTMKQTITDHTALRSVLLRPQHEFVTDSSGRLLVDFAGRVENLQQDFNEICRRIGLPSPRLSVVNASPRTQFETVPDAELTELLTDVYGRDFHLFDAVQRARASNAQCPTSDDMSFSERAA